jgi:acetyltransferase-like isoleucine patch superfamily enzyme
MARFRSVITGFLWEELVSKFRPPLGVVKIGEHTYGSPIIISFRQKDSVTIGKFCSIADDVIIVLSGEHRYDMVSTFPLKTKLLNGKEDETWSKGPVIIGNDVWIGSRAIILSGVKVGDGAIIGAGAVVTDNVSPYVIVAGVPARVLKFRFREDQIRKLLEIAWWNWDLKEIVKNIDYFYGDVNDFIAKFSNKNSTGTKDKSRRL